MPRWSERPSSVSPSSEPVPAAVADRSRGAVERATAVVAFLAIAVWLGGLLALGAIAAPIVFSMVPAPWSANAMTTVFRRFDLVAMACASVVLGIEAIRVVARVPFALPDRMRVGATGVACALAVVEGTNVSPRIAALHWAGAVRGLGSAGMELARLHDVAEWCGKAQVILLVAVVALHAIALSAKSNQPPRQ